MTKYDDFLTAFESHGIFPDAIFCSITGKPLGHLHESELRDYVAAHPKLDAEELADDWLLRLIASMRPSPNWNVMREETLDEMRISHPVETFAYCFNRLTSAPDFAAIPMSERTTQMLARVQNYEVIASLVKQNREAFDKMLHMLIEIDSKNDLAKQAVPFESIVWRDADSAAMLALLTEWYVRECKLYDSRVELAKRTANWVKHGNPLMSHAASKLMQELAPSKEKVKREKKAKEDSFFSGLFESLKTGEAIQPPKPAESFKPKAGAFRLKLNIGVK